MRQTIADALSSFLSTMTGKTMQVAIEEGVEQLTHISLMDTMPNMMVLHAQANDLTVAGWVEPGWIALMSQVMLGETMTPESPEADDVLQEAAAQAYGQVQVALSASKLPQLNFKVVRDMHQLRLPETTMYFRFSVSGSTLPLGGIFLVQYAAPKPPPPPPKPAAASLPPEARPQPSAPRPMVEAIPVSPVAFPDLGQEAISGDGDSGNLSLLIDVELEIVVELGRRRLPLSDILRLSNGSVIELEKMMGEPLQVFANGKFIAEGEAVVIDEQFGVRITSLASQRKRERLFI